MSSCSTYVVFGASQLYKKHNGFQFLMDQIVLELETKIWELGVGAKKFRCLELEPELEI